MKSGKTMLQGYDAELNKARLRATPKTAEEIRASRQHVRNKKLADFLKENELKKI